MQSVDLTTQAEIARLKAGYSRTQRAIEIGGITLFFGTTVLTLLRLADFIAQREPKALGWVVAGALLAGLLVADFASGVVHWMADNWGSPDWPLLGTGFIRPFRHHHLDPEEMTRHDFVELNGNNCIVSLLTIWWANIGLTSDSPTAGVFWCLFFLSTAYWVLGTNQFHAWAHTRQPPALVRLLQKGRLILTPSHHQVHHTPPHERNYCITNGWLNAPLRWVRFFETLEWTVTALTGVRPQHDHVARELVAAREARAKAS